MEDKNKQETNLDPEVLDKVLGTEDSKCNWKLEISEEEFEEYKKGISKTLKISIRICEVIVGVFFIGMISYMFYRYVTGTISEAERDSSENIYENTTEYKEDKEDTEVVMSLKKTGYSITIRYEDTLLGSTIWQKASRPLYYDETTMLVYIKNDSYSALIPYMKDANTQYMWDIDKQELR